MPRVSSLVALCIAFVLMISSVATWVDALSVKIDPLSEQCFWEEVKKPNAKVLLQFQVSSGGYLDIDLSIASPNGVLVHESKGETEGKYTFTAVEVGRYKFCFSNRMSKLTSKTVTFEIHVGDLFDPNLTKLDEKDPIVKSVLRLTEGLSEIQQEQKFYRTREESHRDLAETTNTKVMFWGVAEMIGIVVMAVGQVFVLRQFFKTTRSV
ncbi:hypothetical protein C9374_010290 [Naegleria lovaniensis]|uniref:GOLD domain-containing protein n=1 Tax=Naegleria lovaniensis TaxID=51637 RepID=A0AA88KGI1_NAELO|nr:uncharacterized protein C9374_010290 [Naegleria lovaniensis]KAG2374916.1 hypothetical protein C9374_010290 [Naegleria lovaniensis]